MKILLLFLAPLFIYAKVHYAKVEPYESIVLKSSVNALVVEVDLDSEGSMVDSKRIIHLDDTLDEVNLELLEESVILLHEMLDINNDIASSLKNTVKRKEEYYQRINKLMTASKTQKDNAFSSFTSAKTQYLGIREKIVNLKKQILDMHSRIEQLKDTIRKKSLVVTNKYIYKIMVRKGDYVVPGASLVHVMDKTRAKLVVFLEADELKGLERKSVYLNGNRTQYKVDKVWKVADEKFISSYRAEIYIPSPKKMFSKLMKVEIRE